MKAKEELLAEVTRSRAAISRDAAAVRDELDVAAKVRRRLSANPFAWIGSAAALGWMFAGPKRLTVRKVEYRDARGKKVKQTKKQKGLIGWIFLALRLAFPLLKPVFSTYASRRVSDLANRFSK